MSIKRRKSTALRKEEEAIVAMISNKLHAIFQTRYRDFKKNGNKSKDRGSEKKNNSKSDKVKKTSQQSINGIKNELHFLLAFYGIGTPHIDIRDQPPLPRDKILIMDMDFEGIYFTPEEKTLSPDYLNIKTEAASTYRSNLFIPSDYDLNQVPVWEEMKKFHSFRPLYYPICRQLAQIGYPPDQLEKLQLPDMVDLIVTHNKQFPNQRVLCQRSRFLKMFAACYGDEFTNKMKLLGKEKEATDFLTYIDYLDKPGKCPPEVRYASSLFNVHHVKNRKHAEELDDYSQINSAPNLTLCFAFPHHKVLHTPTEVDLNPNIVFFGGFMREFQITRNPEKERQYYQSIKSSYNKNRDSR